MTKPALTPEEWAKLKTHDDSPNPYGQTFISGGQVFVTGGGTFYQIENLHGAAALCLHGERFGFTREDVGILRDGAKGYWYIADPEEYAMAEIAKHLDDLADRIEALLPPEETP